MHSVLLRLVRKPSRSSFKANETQHTPVNSITLSGQPEVVAAAQKLTISAQAWCQKVTPAPTPLTTINI